MHRLVNDYYSGCLLMILHSNIIVMWYNYSRVADEEEFDEADDGGLEYFIQRHAAAFAMSQQQYTANASAARRGVGTSMSVNGGTTGGISSSQGQGLSAAERLLALNRNINGGSDQLGLAGSSGAMGSASSDIGAAMNITSAGNSPTREEMFGVRRAGGSNGLGITGSAIGTLGLNTATSDSNVNDDPDFYGMISNKANKKAPSGNGKTPGSNPQLLSATAFDNHSQAFDEANGHIAWNATEGAHPPILIG